MQLIYKGFLVRDLNYHLKEVASDDGEGVGFTISDGQIRLGPSSANQVEATIMVKAKASGINRTTDEKKVVTVKVDFAFKIMADEEHLDNLDDAPVIKTIRNYGLSFCILKTQDIIKAITSIDYGTPIVIDSYKIPGNLNISPEP